ncbi:MAG: phage tail protein [Mobilibacterium timonense]|nr:phage tail protein [Mobilibacterium timonense]
MGKEISNIKIKKSVADVATALKCTGGTPEGQETPITLSGYKYDDGDFYVEGDTLRCRSALKKWGRLGTSQHITQLYTFDTTSQSELCAHAVTKLKSIKDTAFSMTADIIRLPDGLGVGDRVIVVDDEGKVYVSTRLLTLERSVSSGDIAATLGDFIQQDPGISSQVQELAAKFAEIATSKLYYTPFSPHDGTLWPRRLLPYLPHKSQPLPLRSRPARHPPRHQRCHRPFRPRSLAQQGSRSPSCLRRRLSA